MLATMLNIRGTGHAARARELSEIWNRISRQHMSAGSGCGCGFGGLILQASDFELDIVEFVIDDAKQEGRAALPGFIDAVSKRGPDRYSVSALLQALPAADMPLGPDDLDFALARLATTLTAIESSHNKGRFACD